MLKCFFIPKTGWGGVILTNKNHILEEEALFYLKQGIINIINGDEPVDIPSNTPIVQLITIGVICLLFLMLVYLLVKMRSKKVRKRSIWYIYGIIFLVLSIAIIPGLTYITDSPWHAIYVFSPDLAYLSIGVVILFALNGLFSIMIAYKQNLQVKYISS